MSDLSSILVLAGTSFSLTKQLGKTDENNKNSKTLNGTSIFNKIDLRYLKCLNLSVLFRFIFETIGNSLYSNMKTYYKGAHKFHLRYFKNAK